MTLSNCMILFYLRPQIYPLYQKNCQKKITPMCMCVMIMGGSRIAVRTALARAGLYAVKIVDNDINRCNRLSWLLDDKTYDYQRNPAVTWIF